MTVEEIRIPAHISLSVVVGLVVAVIGGITGGATWMSHLQSQVDILNARGTPEAVRQIESLSNRLIVVEANQKSVINNQESMARQIERVREIVELQRAKP